MTFASMPSTAFRPPKPIPHDTPIGVLRMILALRRNPLEIWSKAHYEQPILMGRTILGERAVVNEPAAVRRIFLDNVANYRKDALQLRVLGPGLGKGLLTVDGEDWRAQRRALAPLFSAAPDPCFRAGHASRRRPPRSTSDAQARGPRCRRFRGNGAR